MILGLKIALIIGLGLIYWQDLKERAVWWFLFPFVGLLMGGIHWLSSSNELVTTYVSINLLMTTLVLLILWLYTRFIRNKKFLNVSFGLGDVLLFYAFALGFATVTFLILFVASILVALLWSLVYLKRSSKGTIPLAGLMSSFLILVYTMSLLPKTPTLYTF